MTTRVNVAKTSRQLTVIMNQKEALDANLLTLTRILTLIRMILSAGIHRTRRTQGEGNPKTLGEMCVLLTKEV